MCLMIGDHTFVGITKERERGKSWGYIAKRYVLGSAEDARRVYEQARRIREEGKRDE